MADVSRQSWIDNTSLENVRIADRVFVLLNQASEYVYAPGYTQSYIGVRSGDKPCNFFTVTPKKKDAVISIRVIQTAETDAGVKAASADGTFQYKDGWYGVHLDPNGDYTPLVPVLLQAEKEFKKEKGDAALTKTSEWKDAEAEMAELEKNAQMETILKNNNAEIEALKAELARMKAEFARVQAEAANIKAEANAAKAKAIADAAKTAATTLVNNGKSVQKGFSMPFLGSKRIIPLWVRVLIDALAIAIIAILIWLLINRKPQVVEKVVTVHDTVYVEKLSEPQVVEVIVHDTLFIEQIAEIEKNFNAAEFAVGKAELSEDAKFVLHDLAKVMQQNPSIKLRLEGHTSAEGNATRNQKLSEERAKAAVAFLIEREGIEADRLEAVGYGASKLKNTEDPNASENRRTEFIVIE